MRIRAYEVVRQYVFALENGRTEVVVHGRVVKERDSQSPDRPFTWDISHYYRVWKEDEDLHYPVALSASTAEEAELSLFLYASGFTGIDVTPNGNW